MEDVNNESVTQDTPEDASSVSEEASGSSEAGFEEQKPNRAHSRIQSLLEQEKSLKATLEARNKEYEDYKQQSSEAMKFHEMLKANPNKIPKVWELLQAKEEEAQKAGIDPNELDQYDPIVKKIYEEAQLAHTKNRELEQKLADVLDFVDKQKSVETSDYIQSIDRHFEANLQKDGFLDAQGQVSRGYENVTQAMSMGSLAWLAQNAQNPDRPTKDETTKAYQFSKSAFEEYHKMQTMKQKPTVPPSGTKQGQVPSGGKNLQGKSSVEQLMELL